MANDFFSFNMMEPIDNATVVDKVIQRIIGAISEGKFKLGSKLPTETELMELLQVSRNSLREAMKVLSALGLVEIKRGNGTYICSSIKENIFDPIIYGIMLEASNVEDIIELRQMLDEDVLVMAVRKCTQNDIEKLENYIQQMGYYFKSGDLSRAAKMDYEFHMYLAECTRNPFIIRIFKNIYQLFEKSIEYNIRSEEMFAKADEYHQQMVDCLKSRDESRVPEVVLNTLSSWRKNIRRGVNEKKSNM
ncbi:MAG: FadR/GntR family transcriptional regulator [Acetivibrionales bacterium]|jgi:GntR family transcriptional repressor for pyruvate dehydrogenase complex